MQFILFYFFAFIFVLHREFRYTLLVRGSSERRIRRTIYESTFRPAIPNPDDSIERFVSTTTFQERIKHTTSSSGSNPLYFYFFRSESTTTTSSSANPVYYYFFMSESTTLLLLHERVIYTTTSSGTNAPYYIFLRSDPQLLPFQKRIFYTTSSLEANPQRLPLL